MKFSRTLLLPLFTSVLALSSACKTTPHQNTAEVSLDRFDELQLGSKKEAIEATLGKPTEIVSIPGEQDINWRYAPGDRTRIILVIDKKSGELVEKVWQVHENDPESNIQTALGHYPQAHFTRREAKTTNPHHGPNEAWHEDRAIGLSIEINMARNDVSTITWFAPGTPLPPDPVCIKYRRKDGLISCRPQE